MRMGQKNVKWLVLDCMDFQNLFIYLFKGRDGDTNFQAGDRMGEGMGKSDDNNRIQLNFNGSNTFGILKISSRHG